MSFRDTAGILVSGGVGATVGTVITAIIQVISGRGSARANAADTITNASQKVILRLERENSHMRRAIVLLTEANDEIASELSILGVDPALVKKLKSTNRAAKLALSSDNDEEG